MPPITTKTMKELRPALQAHGYCDSNPEWCAKNPKPIDLDKYSPGKTVARPEVFDKLGAKQQNVLSFCNAISYILAYEQCKTTPNNGTCEGVKKATLFKVDKLCKRKVIKKHEEAKKKRDWVWWLIISAASAIGSAILALLGYLVKSLLGNPGGFKRGREAWKIGKEKIKATKGKGFKARFGAVLNAIGLFHQGLQVPVDQQAEDVRKQLGTLPPSGQTATADVTAHPTDVPMNGTPATTNSKHITDGVVRQIDINIQRAAVIMEERWPLTLDALREAEFRIDRFLHRLHETDLPRLRNDLEAASMYPLTELPAEADIDDLREALFANRDALNAFEDTVSVLKGYMSPMVTGHVANRQRAAAATDDLTSMELVDRTWEEIHRYLRAVNGLQTATDPLREIVGTIGSVFSVDAELNDAWRDVIDRARALLYDIDDIMSSYMSVFEQGHIRDNDKAIWVDIDKRAFDLHELSTAEGLIKTIESVLRGRALENAVEFNIPEHFKHIAIPEEQRFALLLIAYSRAKDSIDFRCPDREGENPFVQMWAKIDGDFATIHIIDNGHGILNLEEAKKRGTSLRYAFKLAETNGMAMNCQPRWVPIVGDPDPGEDSKVSAGTEFQIRFRLGDHADTPQGTPSSSGSAVGSGGYGGVVPQNMAPLPPAFAAGGMRFMGR